LKNSERQDGARCKSRWRHLRQRVDSAWRKSRLAARLLLKKEARPLKGRELSAARRLSADPEVTNRLIEQGLYFLGIGERKEAFDRKLLQTAGTPVQSCAELADWWSTRTTLSEAESKSLADDIEKGRCELAPLNLLSAGHKMSV
jgi:hypothetical protein